jgi:hypothetical protein
MAFKLISLLFLRAHKYRKNYLGNDIQIHWKNAYSFFEVGGLGEVAHDRFVLKVITKQ